MENTRIVFDTRTYRLTGLTPILGSSPASRAVRTEFIASKAPRPELVEEESELGPDWDTHGLTVFIRDDEDQLCLMDYQIKGFLKETLLTLKNQLKLVAPKKKIDNLLFIEPRYIPILKDGEPVIDEDDVLERPLLASTAMGTRVTLAGSELIEAPWEITVTMTLLPGEDTVKGKAMTWDTIETALDYGRLKGLAQWRNASYGRFTWQRVDG